MVADSVVRAATAVLSDLADTLETCPNQTIDPHTLAALAQAQARVDNLLARRHPEGQRVNKRRRMERSLQPGSPAIGLLSVLNEELETVLAWCDPKSLCYLEQVCSTFSGTPTLVQRAVRRKHRRQGGAFSLRVKSWPVMLWQQGVVAAEAKHSANYFVLQSSQYAEMFQSFKGHVLAYGADPGSHDGDFMSPTCHKVMLGDAVFAAAQALQCAATCGTFDKSSYDGALQWQWNRNETHETPAEPLPYKSAEGESHLDAVFAALNRNRGYRFDGWETYASYVFAMNVLSDVDAKAVEEAGAARLLVRVLGHDDDLNQSHEIRVQAAETLVAMMATGTKSVQDEIVASGALAALVRTLQNEYQSLESLHLAGQIVLNVAKCSSGHADAVIASGALNPLVQLLSDAVDEHPGGPCAQMSMQESMEYYSSGQPQDPPKPGKRKSDATMKRQVADVLACVSSSTARQDAVVAAGALEPLVQLLRNGPSRVLGYADKWTSAVQRSAATALARVTHGNAINTQAVVTAGVCDLAEQVAKLESINIKVAWKHRTVGFKMKCRITMQKLMDGFFYQLDKHAKPHERADPDRRRAMFMFNGNKILGHQTARDLDMDEGDVIEVVLAVHGIDVFHLR